MISCFLIGQDTSVCVRFFTSDCEGLKPWIDSFQEGRSHVHCHTHLDSLYDKPSYEDELRAWLGSSSCASAVMFIDTRMNQALDSGFFSLCAKAKAQGVFIGVFIDEEKNLNHLFSRLNPNWKLKVHASVEVVHRKVNEILGVIRFTPFIPVASN